MGLIKIIKEIHLAFKEMQSSLDKFHKYYGSKEYLQTVEDTYELSEACKKLNMVSDEKERGHHGKEAAKAGSKLRKILLKLNKPEKMKIKLSRKKLNKIIKVLSTLEHADCANYIMTAIAESRERNRKTDKSINLFRGFKIRHYEYDEKEGINSAVEITDRIINESINNQVNKLNKEFNMPDGWVKIPCAPIKELTKRIKEELKNGKKNTERVNLPEDNYAPLDKDQHIKALEHENKLLKAIAKSEKKKEDAKSVKHIKKRLQCELLNDEYIKELKKQIVLLEKAIRMLSNELAIKLPKE